MAESRVMNVFRELILLPSETEWVEFKLNNCRLENIGAYLSALSNSAALHDKKAGFIVWGIQDRTHKILGTSFKPRKEKVGNEELENWLAHNLNPPINFHYPRIRMREALHCPVRNSSLQLFPHEVEGYRIYSSRDVYEKTERSHRERTRPVESALWRKF